MTDQDTGRNMAGEEGPSQRDRVVVPADVVPDMPAFLGWNEPRTRDELSDVDGETVVKEGRPAPGYERLIRSYTEQRAAMMVARDDADGNGREDFLWMSPHGILHTADAEDGTALQAESGGSSFRVLIDMLALEPRPAPRKGFDPVSVPTRLLIEAADFEGGPGGPAEARREIAGRVRSIAPGIADCLQIGEAELVTFVAEWDGAEADQRTKLIYFDTPAGLLFHSNQAALLRQKHYLEPAPAWVIWAMIVSRLPRPDDVEHWSTALHEGGAE